MATVTVCGLGPGGRDRLTRQTLDALAGAQWCFVRTRRHPTADLPELDGAVAFDEIYERAASFDEVYREIADTVADAAIRAGGHDSDAPGVVYAVPGSPLILERSVRRLLDDDRLDVRLLPAVSFLDEVWARLAVDPVEASVRLVDGHQFVEQAAGERGPILVAHTHARWVLSDIKLAIDAGAEQRAVVLQRLGTPDERIFEVSWPDLDRIVEPDHLTSLYLPEVAAPVGAELVGSVELMRRLRRDCPWDREQTHASLRSYLVEETYEVVDVLDALARDEPAYEDLEEELGDLWFQILFHAELATEAGQFTIADVARSLHEKMVNRHPHVFGDTDLGDRPDSEDLINSWDSIKQSEKERRSALDGIPAGLPALALAAKTLARAERAGIPTDFGSAAPPLEVAAADEADLGRRLFALVAAAAGGNVDPEAALRGAVRAAGERFRAAETRPEGPSPDWVLG
jgi:tetrapyrrole methylase family protein/MazG family protein